MHHEGVVTRFAGLPHFHVPVYKRAWKEWRECLRRLTEADRAVRR